jgi:hypothetical protein
MTANKTEFAAITSSQARLLGHHLLQKMAPEELRGIGQKIQHLESFLPVSWGSSDIAVIRHLSEILSYDDESTSVEVYLCLKSGLRPLDHTLSFWGVYDTSDDGKTRLFISRDVKDLAGTILHTYLSSKNFDRFKCFEAEYALSERLEEIDGLSPLPSRMLQDLEMLTPNETLTFLQTMAIATESGDLILKVRERCEHELIDVASSAQLKSLNTIKYLRGDISVDDLVAARIQWYRQNKIRHLPRLENGIALFKATDEAIDNLLRYDLRDYAEAIVSVLMMAIQPGKIDVRADLFALSVFCSMRRFAFEEIYIEATDRCPMFNLQPDQMAVFSEMYGLGSHCEAYLDVTPKALGRILFDRYRAYYNKHQPPFEADSRSVFATTYPSVGTDIDRDDVTNLTKGFKTQLRNTSYLGVFAVPALIDILLLTTVGRGLYLSAFMTETEQQMSTYAFVFALILCGAVSSSIGAGGSFYLYAMVYPTMNMFMVTRLIGGFVLVSILGIFALVILAVKVGIYAAVIFLLYLGALTIYLFTLALLSVMQFPGTPLPSVFVLWRFRLTVGTNSHRSITLRIAHGTRPLLLHPRKRHRNLSYGLVGILRCISLACSPSNIRLEHLASGYPKQFRSGSLGLVSQHISQRRSRRFRRHDGAGRHATLPFRSVFGCLF